jgi:uncharacterized protein
LSLPLRLDPTPDGRACIVAVKAQPGARRSGALGVWNRMLKVAVTSPAEDGRANEDLARTLGEMLGLRRSAVRLVSGARSREKRFRIEASPAAVTARLEEILG